MYKNKILEIVNGNGVNFRVGDVIARKEDGTVYAVITSFKFTDKEPNFIMKEKPDGPEIESEGITNYKVVSNDYLERIISGLPTAVLVEGIAATGEVWVNGQELTIYNSLKIRKHSPDGFAWGYSGSGPSQLSLALLLLFLPMEIAERYYYTFKAEIAKLKAHTDFKVTINLQAAIAGLVVFERNNEAIKTEANED